MAPKKETKIGKEVKSPVIIKDCHFESKIIWDSETISLMNTVAKGLLNLTDLFKSQEINVTALRVEQTENSK